MFLSSSFRWRGRCHQSADRLGQKVEHPLRHSMAESEIIAHENKVAKDNGESSEDEQPQETEDVLPDDRLFLDGERVPDL